MHNKLDSHTHTIASGHAYNTIQEMARSAADKGLELLAITEHAVNMPGTCQLFYFQNLKILPRRMYGIEVLFGAELNIIDYQGGVDLPEPLLPKLDVCVASLHVPCITSGTVVQNTNAVLGAIENPYVNIIGHPDDGRFPLDYDQIAAAAAQHHTLLEVNNHSLAPDCTRTSAWENYRVLLEKCIRYKTSIILDSDAHWCDDIGNTSYSSVLLKEMNFPEEQIVNTDVAVYKSYINRGI